MSSHIRFAIYYLPPEGDLARFGAEWLGWDCLTGQPAVQPDLPDIQRITEAPRKYGFHATLKPPFHLTEGTSVEGLQAAIAELVAGQPKVTLEGLELARLGKFLALRPAGDMTALNTLAAACVTEADPFRAPPSASELERRRKAGLTPRQDALLSRWGYPYLFEEFRFHMTLSGPLTKAELTRFHGEIKRRLPPLPRPYVIDQIALVGQRPDGLFEFLGRYPLG